MNVLARDPAAAGRPELPGIESLRRLVLLRWGVIACEVAALGLADWLMHFPMPRAAVAAVIGAHAGVNLLTVWRMSRPWLVGDAELTGQLLADVLALTALLHFTGGPANPLISLYLLPPVAAAMMLPRRHAWTVIVLTVGCYSWFAWHQDSALLQHRHPGPVFGLHLIGMWLTFVLSVALVAHFLLRMRAAVRERDRLLARAREEALRGERVVAMGTMAAGAAHELSTPLATMSLVSSELRELCARDEDALECVVELDAQIEQCKRTIDQLLAAAGHARSEGAARQPADRFLEETIGRWQLMRPAAQVDCRWHGAPPAIAAGPDLGQAIISLLNNAADASPEPVEIACRQEADQLYVEIRDRGPGLSEEALRRAGEPYFTTKGPGKGHGVGLFLASATVERHGGRVLLFNRKEGGACTCVVLPVFHETSEAA